MANQHGGKRVGAGAKPKQTVKEVVTVRLSPEVVAFLAQFGRRKAEVLEQYVREMMDKQPSR